MRGGGSARASRSPRYAVMAARAEAGSDPPLAHSDPHADPANFPGFADPANCQQILGNS
jgi:hypothetical protein